MWLIILSDQLDIVDLVGHYPTNNLIPRRPLFQRPKTFILRSYLVLARVSSSYSQTERQVTYVLLTRPPLSPKASFDLHVLSPPLAFALSQDQTLQLIIKSLSLSRTACIVLFNKNIKDFDIKVFLLLRLRLFKDI